MVSEGIWYQEPWSRAVQYWGIKGPPSLPKIKLVSVKKMVLVKIGNITKIGIGMLLLLKEKIGIGMLFTSKNRYR